MLLETRNARAPLMADARERGLLANWRQWIGSDDDVCPLSAGTRDDTRTLTGRALLISYEFPPTGGSGVQRPAKLAKYLPSLGWDVEVLTADHDRFPWRDETLMRDIGPRCSVHRVAGFEPACLARFMASPLDRLLAPECVRWVEDRLYWRLARVTAAAGKGNGQSLWVSSAVRAALRLHRARPFDAVISTGPPHFVHQIALRIRRATGLPWIADLRDPLVSDFDRTPATRLQVQALRRLERAILRHAARVVTTCPALANDLRTRYPNRRPETICSITNGFDREDLCQALVEPAAAQLAEQQRGETGVHDDECVFAAAGALYGRREIGRLVEPMEHVLAAHPEWQGRVRLVLAGSIDARQRRRWDQDRPEWLTLAGYVDHETALRLVASAACNIIMVPDCRHGRLSIPGKTFELLAMPTHVLALAPESSDTGRIVEAAGGSTVVPLEQAGRVASALEQIIADHFAGRLARGRDWSNVDTYERRAVAARFAECLEPLRGGPS